MKIYPIRYCTSLIQKIYLISACDKLKSLTLLFILSNLLIWANQSLGESVEDNIEVIGQVLKPEWGKPTAVKIGDSPEMQLFAGYADGRVAIYNAVTEEWSVAFDPELSPNDDKASKINTLTLNNYSNIKRLYIGYENSSIFLLNMNTIGNTPEGKEYYWNKDKDKDSFDGGPSPIRFGLDSLDEAIIVFVCDNGIILIREGQYVSTAFSQYSLPAENAVPIDVTRPVAIDTEGRYQFFISYKDGSIREFIYNKISSTITETSWIVESSDNLVAIKTKDGWKKLYNDDNQDFLYNYADKLIVSGNRKLLYASSPVQSGYWEWVGTTPGESTPVLYKFNMQVGLNTVAYHIATKVKIRLNPLKTKLISREEITSLSKPVDEYDTTAPAGITTNSGSSGEAGGDNPSPADIQEAVEYIEVIADLDVKYKRSNPNQQYYRKLMDTTKHFDLLISSHEAAKPILLKGGYITAIVPIKIYQGSNPDPAPNDPEIEHTLFLGYSTGEVVKVIFETEAWTGIKDFDVLTKNQPEPLALSVTAICYERERGMLFVGYGDKTTTKTNVNIGLNFEDITNWKKKTNVKDWISCDPNNMLTENISTRGGAIRRYKFSNKMWDSSLNTAWELRDGQTAVQTMRIFKVDEPGAIEGKTISNVFLFSLWGNDKSPQTINYGVDIVPIGPLAVPIPSWSGGDTPDPKEWKLRVFQVTSGDIFVKTYLFDPDSKDLPTAMTFGNHNYDAVFAGYRDGRIERLDLIGDGMGAVLRTVAKPHFAEIANLLYTEFDNKEYLLVNPIGGQLYLFKYLPVSEGSNRKKIMKEVNSYITKGIGSNIRSFKVSSDGKKAVLDLDNNTLQWFDFETETIQEPVLASPINKNEMIMALTKPYKVKDSDNYRIFVAFWNGSIYEFVYDGSKGLLVDTIVRRKSTGAYYLHLNLQSLASQDTVVLDMVRNEARYWTNDIDFDHATDTLFCYTASQEVNVGIQFNVDEANATVRFKAGMGLDALDLKTNHSTAIFPQKLILKKVVSGWGNSDELGRMRDRVKSFQLNYDNNGWHRYHKDGQY